MKTIKDWLQELPEGTKEKALLNYSTENQEKETDNYYLMSEVLFCAFVWQDTPEGHAFWEQLYHSYVGLEKRFIN
ncbi:MAG: hypothetical protein WC827_03570 [Candidatus Paceibacterota bacterium]|jgi:hypothetical protein